MRKTYKIILALIAAAGLVGIGFMLLQGVDIPVLNPQGEVAHKQQQLIIFTVLLGLVVIIPVFVMLFAFAYKYRESSKKVARYAPNEDHNKWIEGLWWGIPIIIIGILSVITWQSSHELDPYKKLSSQVPPVRIQVIALQWKWLFLYPDQQIATVNEVRFPEKTPVNFELTADAPMNGFWIPSLGSQVYAMSGMTSQLSLQADKTGEYYGSSSNISGKGYAGMRFKAISTSKQDFDMWSANIANSDMHLDWNKYDGELTKPSENNQVAYYMLHEPELYNKVIMKYMGSHGSRTQQKANEQPGDPEHLHHSAEGN